MTLEEKLRSMHQGLPGLGVDASTGLDGRKGKSIYIGHVKDFFDGIMLTEEEKGYIRIKNQKQYRLPENKQFYYKRQKNFYRHLTEEIKRMTTFSIYNLHGMYLTPGVNPYNPAIEQGGYDFSRFGWSLDLKCLLDRSYELKRKREIDSQAPGESTSFDDPAIKKFKTWIKKIVEDGRYEEVKGKLYILGSEAGPEENEDPSLNNGTYYNDKDTDSSMYFKYISLNRNIIGDPSYPNPYTVEDFDNAVFSVHVGNYVDEETVDISGIDYLNERAKNQQKTNYSTRYTPDVLIPTTLSSKYKEGDILYFLDDVTEKIMSYIVVTTDMVRCRYDYFLTKSTVPIKSLLSPFKMQDNRIQGYKNLILHDIEINDSLAEYKNNAVDNFIKKYDNNYALSVMSNKTRGTSWLTLGGDDFGSKTLEVTNPTEDKFSLSVSSLKLDNLWIKDCGTNINVPEYFNSNIILVDGFHIDNIDEKDFINDYRTIRISSSKFFYSSKNDSVFGFMVIADNGDVLSTYEFSGPGSHDVKYFDDLPAAQEGHYSIMSFALEPGTTKYYSEVSTISFTDNGDQFEYSKNDIIDEVQDIYLNDNFSFFSSNISCEKGSFSVSIEPNDGVTLREVWINDTKITPQILSNTASINSWISIASGSTLTDINFDVSNNIPNEAGYDSDNIAAYLEKISEHRKIGDKIQETLSRSVVLTAIGVKDGQIVRTGHKIVQPGFENPIKDVSVSFNNILYNNAIEKSNLSENGVLCNQIQYFTEMQIHGFTSAAWATYLDNPKIYVYLNLDNDIDSATDTDESNFNNVHFYSMNDKNMFKNNALRAKFSWIPNSTDVAYDSSMYLIEEVERDFNSYAYVFGDINDATHIDSSWIYFSDASFLQARDTLIPKDIVFRLEDESYIGGISIADANRDTKIKIRTIAEVGNPVPMEFNFKWRVSRIEVRGKVKEEFVRDGSADNRKELTFTKTFVDSDGFTYYISSPNIKFIVNPVYMTACPEEAEHINGAKIGTAIMNVGPTDGPSIRVGIQDIDQAAKDEFFIEKRYDLPENRLKESRGNYNYVSDITYYWPKKRYLQDNIQSLFIKPRDFKGDVLSKTITKKNSIFVEMIEDLKPQESILQNMYNVSLLDVTSSLNSDYSKSFLMSAFNGYVMNPEYRNEQFTFYYNNLLYPERIFDQWNSLSPLWSEQKSEIEVVDSSLLTAKQTWNYEYEVSKDYVPGKTCGGVITKSGNGYLEISSEQSIEEYDTGQYDVIGTYGLTETLAKSDEYILATPDDSSIVFPTGFVNAPTRREFYRTMLFDVKWIYPYFININNTLMIQPYYFANSYEGWLDSKVMVGYMEARSQDTLDSLKTYISSCDVFQGNDGGTESRKWYVKDKLDSNLYLVKNNYLLFEGPTEKTKINMFMPYNVCYDIYPRTMYNSDSRNTVNVFMLQRPTITRNDNYSLDKHYFKIPPFNDDEAEKAYYATFEDGRQVVASVLPPWYFNR